MRNIRTLGVIAAVAGALLLGVVPASAIPLLQGLDSNNQIAVGDKVFTFTSCSATAVGNAGPASCGSLAVHSMVIGPGNDPNVDLYGFRITGSIFAKGAGSTEDIFINYTVTIDTNDWLFSDAHQFQVGTPSALNSVTQTLTTPSNHLEGVLNTDGTSVVDNIFTADFVPVLKSAMHIHAAGATVGGILIRNNMSNIVTEFSQVPNRPPFSTPEPGTLALFGVGLLGLGALRRRRKVA